MTDEEGVLGNLPSSRPGRRSTKRDAPSDRPAKAADKAKPRQPPPPEPARPEPSDDFVGTAVRTAAGVAVTGVKVAGAVAQELFRRLPRP